MTTVLGRRQTAESVSKTVKYTPCSKVDVQTDEEELDDVNVDRSNEANNTPQASRSHLASVSSSPAAASCSASPHRIARDDGCHTPTGSSGCTANGPPRGLPGSLTTFHGISSDRTSLIGERLSRTANLSISSPLYPVRTHVEPRARSTSKHSLFELVTHRLDRVKTRKSRAFSKEEVAYVNKGHVSDVLTPKEIRKQRRKEIEQRFGKKSQRVAQQDVFETLTASSDKDGCRWTFVFDPSGRLAYWWSFVVSIAFLYNFWVIIYRFAFEEINEGNMAVWFTLDYFADLLYILDIGFHFRTGFLEDGVLQTDSVKLRLHYMNSTMFYIDCLCLLPLDFLYLSIGFKSMLRCFRLVKIYRFWAFLDRTERHTNYPNVVRTVTLLHYLFAVYHWNACFMHRVTKNLENDHWKNPPETADVLTKYLHALYWSVLTLTTIGDLPRPSSKGEYIFVIVEFVFGLLLFASILGHVANIVTSISFARKDFQAKLDSVKTYMSLRRVPLRLQDRVIRWFDYLWLSKKSSDEEKTLNLLPDKLKAEIALHVHLDTLKRVEIFQNTEAGFLCELVLKLRPVLFSPGDYICRKGEVGKEMYIVARGRLQVVADNGKTVLATLRPGSYFGEISILNMGNAGNRRTASVRSVGYSDLFCLKKQDLWDVLKDYPTARVRLEAIAVKRLEKYKKAPLEQGKDDLAKVALPRSKSTPGLVESRGKVPLEQMIVHPLPEGSKELTPPTSSLCSGLSGRGDGAGSERRFSFHSGSGELAAGAMTGITEQSGEITHSMTVSSITSYVTDSSGKKSPHGAVGVQGSPQHENSPPLMADAEMPPVSSNPFTVMHGMHTTTTPATMAMAAALYPRPAHTTAAMAGPAFHEYFTPFPPDGLASRLQGSPMSTSQTFLPVQRVTTATGFAMSASASSLPVDPNTEVLLAEITRLRDRLHTLENENTSMSKKLSQQKWEVEHRLAEIEMHICGSDNGSGIEDEPVIGNKESVI